MKNIIKNKKVFVIALVLLCGIAVTSTTLAMLTDRTGVVTNLFSAGDVNTHIEEKIDDQPIAADTAILKRPVVVNEGPSNAFIRARLTITPSSAGVKLLAGEWSAFEGADKEFLQTAVVYDENGFSNNGNWLYCEEDGFYYYTLPIAEGEQTASLFDAVMLNESADVTVYQEAVLAHDTYSLTENVEIDKLKDLFDSVTVTE